MLRATTRSFSTTSVNQLAKMSLIGFIGSDLTSLTTSSDKNYLKYSLAVNSKNKGVESTSWFNIAVFNPYQIEFMQKYLAKGAQVYVEADASNTSFEREDGSKSYSLMLFQTNVEILKFPKSKETEDDA